MTAGQTIRDNLLQEGTMKKLVILALSLILLVSCGAKQPLPSETAPDTSGGITFEDNSQQTDSVPEQHNGKASEPVYKDLRYNSALFNYPDKTVIVWQYEGIYADISEETEWAVNEYLNSVGRDYAVCFSPVSSVNPDSYYLAITKGKLEQGLPVDILGTGATRGEYASVPYQYVSDGLFEPLDTDEEALLEIYPKSYLETLKIDGKIYGLCAGEQMISYGSGYSVNKELAEKYGWDINKPISEQLDILEAVSKNEPDCAAFVSGISLAQTAYYPSSLSNIPGVFYDENADRAGRITDDKDFISMLEPLGTVVSRGLYTEYLSYVSNDWKTFFIHYGGQGSPSYRYGEEYVESLGNNSAVVIGAYDGFSIGSAAYMTGVCAKSAHKKEALDFLLLSQSDAYINNLLTYGIEGTDYKIIDGVADKTAGIKAFSNSFICTPNASEPADYSKRLREFFDGVKLPSCTGFCFDAAPVADSFKAVRAALQNRSPAFSDTGELTEQLKDALEKAGIEELLAEVNRQYDKWRENVK